MENRNSVKKTGSPLLLAAFTCLLFASGLHAQATPRQVTPLQNGDKVLFIGNSFTDWFGPLPSAIQSVIQASGSGLSVSFTVKVKGMGILKEYATWSSLGMVDEIRKGGWKYVVIQGWEDAINRKDSQTSEGGATITDYTGWPACQDTMLKYLRVLDAEVRAVGAITILYEPHVGASGYLTNLDHSNQTYARLKYDVSLFHAPVITAWDSLRYRYPTTVYACSGFTPGSFIDKLYSDCGHQNSDGMALDAMVFYTILTRRSASTLRPLLLATMKNQGLFEEFAQLAYKTGKAILTMNNSGFTDAQAPTVPAGLQTSNVMPDSYILTWTASTDNTGVLGYRVYRDNVLIGTTAVPRLAVGGLSASTTYAMKVRAFDSEDNISDYSTALNVTTSAATTVDTSGALLAWDFRGLGGSASIGTTKVMAGISSTAPSAVIDAGPVFLANNYFGGNGFSMTMQTKTTLADAITGGEYVTFTVAPLAGNRISIDSVRLRPFTQNQPRTFTLMSSVAGFAAGSAIGTVTGNGVSGTSLQTIAVSGHDSVASSIEFRVYVWGPNNQYESFGIGNRNVALTEDDLIVFGSVKSSGGATFPTNLSASSLTETGFTLHWAAASGAVSYEVFRNGVSIGTTAALSTNVTGVSINATYSMTVTARNGAGTVSEASTPLDVTIPDLTLPSVPLNLSVTAVTENSFVLHWDTSSDNVGVTRYDIFMDGNAYGNTGVSYLPVPYLTPSTSYSMTVRSRDAAGNVSAQSAALVVRTGPATGVAPGVRRVAAVRVYVSVTACDLFGRVVKRWDHVELAPQPRLSVPIAGSGLSRGAYLLRIQGASVNIQTRVMVW
jgi:chitodextrinase